MEAHSLLERDARAQNRLGRRSEPLERWTPTIQSQLWLATGRIDRALESAREGLREMSGDATAAPHMKSGALVELARAELATGRVRAAKAHVEQALELVPTGAFDAWLARPRALRVLGILELHQGHPEKALELHSEALVGYTKALGPESPYLAFHHLALARVHTSLESLPQALLHTQKSIQLQTTMAMGENHTLTTY